MLIIRKIVFLKISKPPGEKVSFVESYEWEIQSSYWHGFVEIDPIFHFMNEFLAEWILSSSEFYGYWTLNAQCNGLITQKEAYNML